MPQDDLPHIHKPHPPPNRHATPRERSAQVLRSARLHAKCRWAEHEEECQRHFACSSFLPLFHFLAMLMSANTLTWLSNTPAGKCRITFCPIPRNRRCILSNMARLSFSTRLNIILKENFQLPFGR